ncbi:MAG: hypothetical protein ABIS38_04315 [Sphingomicrobium sp.]
MILRLLGWQGIAGLALAAACALLLLVQKGETRHWRRQSGHYEQLYRSSETALAGTIANYRAAAERARAADLATAARVADAQRAITERTADDYQNRLAAARARADRLRRESASAATDPGARRTTPVSGVSAAPGEPAQAPGQDRLPHPDRLTATEQAIQLDELIKWIRRQQAVDPNARRP